MTLHKVASLHTSFFNDFCNAIWLIYIDKEQPQKKETSFNNQDSYLLEGNFGKIDNVRAPIQFRRER